MNKHFQRLRQSQGGYTLVEIAMVLAVIGLIVGGMSIAKEVVREAEYSRIQNKFLMPWKTAYDLYYQRTGTVLGDSQIAPTFMINGFEAQAIGTAGDRPGVAASYNNTGLRICQGRGYENNSVGAGDPSGLALQKLHDLFDRAGVRMPAGRAEGQEDRYVYQDSNGNPAEVQICFQWNADKQTSGAGNAMVIRGLTPDLARKLDQAIDGKADALEGRFRQQNSNSNLTEGSSQMPGHEWLANNTYAQGGNEPTARGRGESRDEDRVALVTAHWLMDQ